MVYGNGTCAGVDYNPTLRPLQSRLQHIYHGQPYARVDPMPGSTLSPSQGLWIWPVHSAEIQYIIFGTQSQDKVSEILQLFLSTRHHFGYNVGASINQRFVQK